MILRYDTKLNSVILINLWTNIIGVRGKVLSVCLENFYTDPTPKATAPQIVLQKNICSHSFFR